MNNGTTSQTYLQTNINTIRLDEQQTTDTSSGGPDDVYVLHWMQPTDVDMAAELDIEAQALCGEWGEADVHLASDITGGRKMVRYVSCEKCDRIKWGAAS